MEVIARQYLSLPQQPVTLTPVHTHTIRLQSNYTSDVYV